MGLCSSRQPREEKQAGVVATTNQAETSFKVGPDIFVPLKQGSLNDFYERKMELGKGAFGDVWLVIYKQTQQKRAMKHIKKDKIIKEDEDNMFAEVNILKELDHPNIVKLHELYQDTRNYYLITEYLEGGELFQKITDLKSFSEKMAADFMKQILSAVMYCHERKIVHRDLKPENILLESKKPGANLKVIDFGTSKKLVGDQKLKKRLGTPYYIAPEVLKRDYNEKCDVWSCGVILYIMLCGYPPFGGYDQEILQNIEIGKFEFDPEDWGKISEDAKNLIKKMLEKDPNKRISAKDAYNDPWIQKNAPSEKIDTKALKNMTNFYGKNKIRTALMQFIATQVVSSQEKSELLKAFKAIDLNGDGKLSKDEMLQVYRKQYDELKAQQMVDEVFGKVDIDGSGFVDYTEFVSAAMQEEKLLNKLKLEQTFKIFDINGDGFISRDEMQEIMGSIDDVLWKEVLQNCDANGDGQISQQEFITFLCQKYNNN